MMYCEFIEGTGCKDNETNYNIFEGLEIVYLNTEISKEEIYKIGKKLVDNSKTKEQIEFENKIEERINYLKNELERYNDMKKYCEEEMDDKESLDYFKRVIKTYRTEIKNLKFVLS